MCYGNWCIEIRKYWCILSLDLNQGVCVLMPELAVSFISVSVKDSSVCCWGTVNRLFICFSSKHCSFVYNTIRSNLILTCCSPLSPIVGMAMSKIIYICTHNWKGGKQPLRMQWTKKALGGPDLMRTFIRGSWMHLPNMIVIVHSHYLGARPEFDKKEQWLFTI